MLPSQNHTQVLIVGAGPSGLMMAAQLLRNGVQPLIIDIKQGPTDESKALAVQARSLEIYRQLGVVNHAVENGKPAEGVIFNDNGKQAASLAMQNVGEGLTPFPYILLYQQSKNERLLLDYLTRNACPVYWETTLTSLKQTPHQAEVQLQNAGGTTTITCDYVVGADGAHSAVRKLSGGHFNGETYAHNFYLADVEVANTEINSDYVNLFLARGGFSAFFPMAEAGRFRALGNLPIELENKEDLAIEDILPGLEKTSGLNIHIKHTYWFTKYRLHHCMADNFRMQRCFLIGDAAHIHSPVGGQGMNTGLQDAYNLAWKLAGVVKGEINTRILESYAMERMPVAKALLRTTDRMFNLITSASWFNTIFKRWLMPLLLKLAWGSKTLRTAFFKQVSQIAINYRDSRINLHISQSSRIKAGDRLPYLALYDEKRQEETDLHEWCAKPGFTLITLGKMAETELFVLAKWINSKYSGKLNFFHLPKSERNQHIFDAFEVNEKQGMSVIVRPDMYIGFLNDKIDTVLMDNYLRNVVGIGEDHSS
ncbi:MAG: FAD-dependent monooxygenase [Mucilaginibacter sp.]